MQWSYHLRSTILATTSKFKMAAIFETSHLFVRRYTFFPRPMFSRVRNAMKLSFLFYDHSNYLKLLWELQIDVSIIYSFCWIFGGSNFGHVCMRVKSWSFLVWGSNFCIGRSGSGKKLSILNQILATYEQILAIYGWWGLNFSNIFGGTNLGHFCMRGSKRKKCCMWGTPKYHFVVSVGLENVFFCIWGCWKCYSVVSMGLPISIYGYHSSKPCFLYL